MLSGLKAFISKLLSRGTKPNWTWKRPEDYWVALYSDQTAVGVVAKDKHEALAKAGKLADVDRKLLRLEGPSYRPPWLDRVTADETL